MIRKLLDRLRAGEDQGFSLIEIVVAMMIIAVGLLGLMAVQVKSLTTISLAGQRQAASQLANKTMEQLRALPYGTLTGGLVCSDLTDVASNANYDPNITVVASGGGCTVTFRPAYDSSINEKVVTQTGTQVAPVFPHKQAAATTRVGGTQYTVRSYVTRVNPDPTVDAGYWLTVISTWTHRGQPKSLATRSQVYSPQGCLALTTHPFSGPCQAYFYTDAGVAGGGLSVASTRPGLSIVDGLDVKDASATLLDLSTRIQSEQVVSTQSQTTVSGGTMTLLDGTVSKNGAIVGSSVADTDPASGVATSPSAATPVSPSGAAALTRSGGGTQFSLNGDLTGTGSALSTVTSSTTPSCVDDVGTALINGQACTSGTTTPGGAVTGTLKLSALGTRTFVLGDVAPGSAPSRAFGGRFLTGTSSHCSATSGIGCVKAAVRRTLGTVRAGGLPPTTSTGDKILNASSGDVTAFFTSANPRPLVTVTGYSDRAQSESGIAPGAAVTTRTGTLTYWNGTSFVDVALATAGTQTLTIPTTTGSYGATSIVASGVVTVVAPSAPTSGTAPCIAAACETKASAGSVVAKLTYTIKDGVDVVGGFSVTLDLGNALAQSTYKGAPSA